MSDFKIEAPYTGEEVVQVTLAIIKGGKGSLPQAVEGRAGLTVAVLADGEIEHPIVHQASSQPDLVLMVAAVLHHLATELGSGAVLDALCLARKIETTT